MPYLPGLDGLRAIAVAAVLVYHADLGVLPAGFLGVDVFFAISGFLITSLLLVEWGATGRIDLRRFWLRRARRLLPALFVVLVASLAFAVAFMPDSVARLRADAIAAAAYVTNWYLVAGEQSYFATLDRQSPLLHLWSLAVEEQFYLVWPIVLAVVLRVVRPWAALGLTIAAAAASAVWMAVLFDPLADSSRVYYGTDTRLFALLAGAALAFATAHRLEDAPALGMPATALGGPALAARTRRRVPVAPVDGLALGCLVVLGWFAATTDAADPALYLGGLAVVALASVGLIAAVTHPAARAVPWLLERRVVRWVGTRSYGIYLWHWPLFSITRPGLDVPLDGPALLALRIGLTLVIAELSYRLVERPIRSGALERAWRDPVRQTAGVGFRRALVGGTAIVSALSLAAAVALAAPPGRPDYLPVTGYDEVVAVPSARPSAGPPPTAGSSPASSSGSGASFGPERSPEPSETGVPVRPAMLAVGDSVLVAVAPALAEELGPIEIDAQIGRQVADGLAVLEERRAEGRLAKVVIVDLGTNGPILRAQFERAMEILRDVPLVVWINVTVPRPWEDHTNLVLAQQVPKYPNARLVDWHAASDDEPDLFEADGYHPRPHGAALFARLIGAALD